MSTLFLVGNGFDLNCGMKTRYTDVYEGYVGINVKSQNLVKFKENIERNLGTWGDFEIAMAQYANCVESENEFLECVRDFSAYMEEHLKNESKHFFEIMGSGEIFKDAKQEFIRSIREFCTGITHNIDVIMQNRSANNPTNIEAISFNYTKVFDYLLHEVLKNYPIGKNVTHIHGELGDGPVIGVNSADQLKTRYPLSKKGIRSFVKPVFNEEFDQFRVEEAKGKIRRALTICVFGMSLGESDLLWRNEIVEWLRNDENHHLFIYRFDLSQAKFLTIAEKMDMEDEAKAHLFSEWGISSTENIYDRIHIPCGKNIFNIHSIFEFASTKETR